MLGGLQSELAGVAYKVFGGTHRVKGVTTRVLESETHLEFVVPLESLLVVVIGLQRHGSYHRVIALATLIPVVGHIVLEELQAVVAAELPEVGLLDIYLHGRHHIVIVYLRRHEVDNVGFGLDGSGRRLDDGTYTVELALRADHEVGTMQIDIEQTAVELRYGVAKAEGVGGNAVIECERHEEAIVTAVGCRETVATHGEKRVDTGAAHLQRVDIRTYNDGHRVGIVHLGMTRAHLCIGMARKKQHCHYGDM